MKPYLSFHLEETKYPWVYIHNTSFKSSDPWFFGLYDQFMVCHTHLLFYLANLPNVPYSVLENVSIHGEEEKSNFHGP